MSRRVLPPLLVACATFACSSSEPPGGSGGAAGAAGAATSLDVRPFVWSAAGPVPIVAGGSIELWAAPQGGHVARIGAEVGGLETDTAELVARLREPDTGALVAQGSRTAPMVTVDGKPEMKQPEPSSMYNVVHLPLCPDATGRAIDGQGYLLEVQVTELYADFSEGQATRLVTPTCDAQDPDLGYCQCECGAGYSPGQCSGDGGTLSDSGTP